MSMQLTPQDAMARAEALMRAGDIAGAEGVLRALLVAQPDNAAALNALAVIVLGQNRPQEAVTLLEQALRLRPGAPVLHCNLANALRRTGRADEALAHAQRAVAARPEDQQGLAALASAHLALRQFARAREIVTRLLPLAPDNPDAWLAKATLDLEDHDARGAIAAAQRALEIMPDNTGAQVLLARALLADGKAEQALEAHQHAVALAPEAWEAHFELGQMLRDMGRFEEAQAAFRTCLTLDPAREIAWVSLTEVKRFRTGDDADLVAMERVSQRQRPAAEALHTEFALAKAYDDLKGYENAARHMLRANAAKRAAVSYDEASALSYFARLKRAFDADAITRLSGSGAASDLPIFVFGMPRSGTTLVEQIVASHSEVAGGGELEDLDVVLAALRSAHGERYPECVRELDADTVTRAGDDFAQRLSKIAPGARRITDKAPSTYFHVGMVHLSLPRAKLIHVTRNPADTCLSCFSKLFARGQDHCYDLAELGRYYRAYHDLMQHWGSVLPAGAFLDVRYEEVVTDTEAQARRILEFCALDWDPAVLDFHKDGRAVNTLSAQQVRQPIYGSSLDRWRHYEAMLQPLLRELGDLVQS
jgi:tetratricopeptide (TPR) repeat protein